MALFFQREITQGAAGSGSTAPSQIAPPAAGAAAPAFPVLLLSGDNAQIQLAKSHGLPAVRMGELGPLEAWLAQHAQRGPPLTASLIRQLLGAAATVGEPSVKNTVQS